MAYSFLDNTHPNLFVKTWFASFENLFLPESGFASFAFEFELGKKSRDI